MTGDYRSDILTVLVYLLGVAGTALILISLWVAKRVVNGLDAIEKKLNDELGAVRELFHDLDKRIIRLESWRDAQASRNHFPTE